MVKEILWHSEKRKLSELSPSEYNPRQASEKQSTDLKNSLTKFNIVDPIIINKNNTIIGGHFRIRELEKLGIKEADVRVPIRELTTEEEKELNIRLNKNTGDWDLDLLANFDEELLKDIGFESEELDKIFSLDTSPEDDEVPDVKKTNIKLGDLFILGGETICPHCKTRNGI